MKQIYIIGLLLFSILVNAQITEVKDINDGSGSSSPANLIVFNGKLYFAADDSSGVNTGSVDYGKELWVTDGTSSGTMLIKNINSTNSDGLTDESQNSSPFAFFELDEKLYFTALDRKVGFSEIFVTDGTEAETVSTSNGFSNVNPIVVEGKAYMTATTLGNIFYEFDGTTFQQVPDNGDGTANPIGGVYTEFDSNSILLYMDYSTETDTVGRELYIYDITAQTYTLVKDVDAGTGDSSISNFTKLGSLVYFEADNELWVTDTTTDGTIKVSVVDIAGISSVNNFYAWNDKLFFEGDNGTDGDQLYVYDPVLDTVTNISNIGGDNSAHDPSDYAAYNGYLYYRGEDEFDGDGHLFRTNGVTIEQIDNTIIDIDEITVFNNKLYFEADNGNGNELFMLDPTTLSISNAVLQNSISVYPNPSKGYLNIQSELTGTTTYSFYNILGKQILSGIVSNSAINHNLISGIYFLKLNNGENSITKKVIVKN